MKVHVSRSVNQIQYILLSPILVLHLDGMALDCNTSLLSRSISSSICPSVTWMVFVNSNKRSAKVDFPWSICAIMQKLRIFFIFNSYLFKNKQVSCFSGAKIRKKNKILKTTINL